MQAGITIKSNTINKCGLYMKFINDSFMIGNARGVQLYQDIAKELPIIDYHCHLDARKYTKIRITIILLSYG